MPTITRRLSWGERRLRGTTSRTPKPERSWLVVAEAMVAAWTHGSPTDRDYGWMDRAKCQGADTNLFYASSRTSAAAEYRFVEDKFCSQCPVRAECVAHAVIEEFVDRPGHSSDSTLLAYGYRGSNPTEREGIARRVRSVTPRPDAVA